MIIKWRQDYEQIPCAEVSTKRVKLPKPIWHEFDCSDINHMPRNHALSLFNNSTPVVILEDGKYIVNNSKLLADYKAKGHQVTMLSNCQRSDEKLCNVGFLERIQSAAQN